MAYLSRSMKDGMLTLHQPATTSQPAREFYYQERDRTHSVVANVNTVIARFGKKG